MSDTSGRQDGYREAQATEDRLRCDNRQQLLFIILLLGVMGDRMEFTGQELTAAEEAALLRKDTLDGGVLLRVIRDPKQPAPERPTSGSAAAVGEREARRGEAADGD